jgi:hypothetical protein
MNFRDKKYKRHLLCKALSLLVAGILILLQLSCTSDVTSMIKDDTAIIHVTFGIDKTTRALSTNESAVNDITVLVFNGNSSSSDLIGSNYKSFTGAGPYSVDVTARTGNSTIYAIANTGSNSYFKGVATIGDFKKKFDLLSSGDDLTSKSAVLMFGQTTCTITAGVTIPEFKLTRLCTKLTFNITPSNGITVTGYKLRSVPTSSYINDDQSQTPSYNPANNWVDCTAVSIGIPVAGAAVPAFTYYIYENLVGTSSTSVDEKSRMNAPSHATYLEVYASTSVSHSTYRIYLGGMNTTDYTNFNIQRNNSYVYNVNITGPGQNDARVTYVVDQAPVVGNYYYSDGSWGSSATPTGKTVIGVIFSITTSSKDQSHGWTHGYAMALTNAASAVTWSPNTSALEFPSSQVTSLIGYETEMDGYTHCQTIKTKAGSNLSSNYPAIYYAMNYSTYTVPSGTSGWYLPSSGQWYQIITNLGGISTGTTPTSTTDSGSGLAYWYYSGGASTASSGINSYLSKVVSGSNLIDWTYSSSDWTTGRWYWCSSEGSGSYACNVAFNNDGGLYLGFAAKTYTYSNGRVRSVVAF